MAGEYNHSWKVLSSTINEVVKLKLITWSSHSQSYLNTKSNESMQLKWRNLHSDQTWCNLKSIPPQTCTVLRSGQCISYGGGMSVQVFKNHEATVRTHGSLVQWGCDVPSFNIPWLYNGMWVTSHGALCSCSPSVSFHILIAAEIFTVSFVGQTGTRPNSNSSHAW